jgi:MFS family permease
VNSNHVIRNFLLIQGLFTLSASFIWGINTLFLLHAGLTIFEVFVANAAFTAAMALFEIPTGVVADTRGRRASFVLSTATLLVGTLAYVGAAYAGGGVLLFSLAGVVLGLGFSLYTGSVEAWAVDALKATGYHDSLDPVFARAGVIVGAATLVGTVGGGLLGQLDLSLPYVARAVLLVVALFVGLRSMHDLGFTPRTLRWGSALGEVRNVAHAGMTYGLRRPAVRLLMLQSFVAMGFMYWAWYAWQPYFLELAGGNAVWIAGVIAALFSLAGILGSFLASWLARDGRKRTTLLLLGSAVFTVAMVATGLIQQFWITVAVFLLGAVAAGVVQPIRQTYLHQSIPSSERATLVSFDSLVGSLGSIGGSTGLGYLSEVQSVPAGFVVGGAATLLVLPIFARLRALNEPADRIVAEPVAIPTPIEVPEAEERLAA